MRNEAPSAQDFVISAAPAGARRIPATVPSGMPWDGVMGVPRSRKRPVSQFAKSRDGELQRPGNPGLLFSIKRNSQEDNYAKSYSSG
jgi:hypothetical protein